MITLADVSVAYDREPVVAGVSAEVPSGSWLAVIGPNGAGKSTLLKAVAGLVPSSGRITVDGTAPGELAARARARVLGYAPQSPVLPEGLTVTDYVLLGRTPHLGALAREGAGDLAVVAGVLERLDLAHLASRPLRKVSGGERQRAVLGRVLAQQTGVLLLDEPTTGLDIGHAQSLLDLVDRLRVEDGTTVVSTLHDLTLAAQYADNLLMLDRGRPVAQGSAEEVLRPEVIARHYGADVEVVTTARGHRVVVPSRA